MLSLAHTHIAGVFSGRSRRSQLVFALHLKWFIALLQPVTFAIDCLENVALARYAPTEVPQYRLRLPRRRPDMFPDHPRVDDLARFEQLEKDLMRRTEFHRHPITSSMNAAARGATMALP